MHYFLKTGSWKSRKQISPVLIIFFLLVKLTNRAEILITHKKLMRIERILEDDIDPINFGPQQQRKSPKKMTKHQFRVLCYDSFCIKKH